MLAPEHTKFKIMVDFDKASNRLMIQCPYAMNEHAKSLPNRRWDPKRKVWTAPLIRLNVERIEALVGRGLAELSANATIEIDGYWEEKETQESREQQTLFPSWYKFKTDPWEHQRKAYAKLYGKSAIALFMDMRTGKSKTAIDMLAAARMEGRIDSLLVICKLSLRKDWLTALEEHCPIPYDALLPGTGNRKEWEKWLGARHDFKIIIVGIESLSQGGAVEIAQRFINSRPKPACVMDESSKISNPSAIRSKRVVDIASKAKMRLAMTGTPMSKGPMNIFMQFEFLDPDIIGIGDYYSFRNRYAVMGGYEGKQVIGYDHLDELAQIIAPYVHEVKRSDVFDIPRKQFQVRTVALAPEQKESYKQLRRTGGIEGMTPKNVLEEFLRLHEIVQGFVGIRKQRVKLSGELEEYVERKWLVPWDKSPKIVELADVFEEFPESGHIVWCQYLDELEAVKNLCEIRGLTYALFYGGNESTRDHEKEEFRAGRRHVFIGIQSVGDMGLELSIAHTVTYLSNGQRYEGRIQSEDRTQASTQKNSVLYIDLIAERTVDEAYYKALLSKQDLIEYVRKLIRDKSLDSVVPRVL